MGFAFSYARAVFLAVAFVLCGGAFCGPAAWAQTAPASGGQAVPPSPAVDPGGQGASSVSGVGVQPPGGVFSAMPARDWMLDPERLHSLFFSTWTHDLLDEACRGLKARAPTPEELAAGLRGGLEEETRKDPGIRELSLGGIVYADSKDWTVWLNGQRVRQDAMPPEILDLRVFETHIDLKWFDAYTNQVFPIRLRPHQRFNLDSRIFLPG